MLCRTKGAGWRGAAGAAEVPAYGRVEMGDSSASDTHHSLPPPQRIPHILPRQGRTLCAHIETSPVRWPVATCFPLI